MLPPRSAKLPSSGKKRIVSQERNMEFKNKALIINLKANINSLQEKLASAR
jgi:hypothetical protein